MTAKIAEYIQISADINYIRARILRQSKLNEYIIIDSKVGVPIEIRLKIPWPMHSQVNALSASRS
jgi:hypothetical protein